MYDRKHKLSHISVIVYLFLILAMVISFYPFLWMIYNSFRTTNEIFQHPLELPKDLNLSVFLKSWEKSNFNSTLLNSSIVTSCAVTLIVFFSSFAAYPLSRMKFKGRSLLYAAIVSGQIVSAQIILIPLFVIFRDLKLLGSLASTVISGTAIGIPLSVILFTNSFRGVPKEIDDSTEIDGCSRWRYFWSILIPITKPTFASVITFQSLFVWNEYLFSLTFLNNPKIRTVPLQLKQFFAQYSTDWSGLFAALTIAVVPLLVLYLFLQKYFIKGLTAGAVKG